MKADMLRPFLKSSFALLLAFASASASTVYSINSGTLTATRIISSGGEMYDVRGLVDVNVSDSGLLGQIFITDSTLGTDPGFAVLPFGNAALYGTAGGEWTYIALDFANPVFTPTTLTLFGTGSAVTPPVAGAALARTLGPQQFDFELTGLVDQGNQAVATYSLTQISAPASPQVPEPASSALLGAGVLLLALGARLRARR